MFDYMFYRISKKGKEKEEKKKRKQGFRIIRARRLMQAISKELQLSVGSRCPEKYIINAIIKIRGIDNKKESTTTKIWYNRLRRLDYIRHCSYNMVKVIDTGASWFDKDWSELT